ncbi:MAG TPA: helix-turn-helix domain-containing protein [Nocardioidaceae bacterium]|nr:helix-turn-helix domain-containing protein [Nocardioidaceae bacterium]
MPESTDPQVAAVAALDEPTRRRLYDHVVRQRDPVSRDDAAEAVAVPRSTAAFHLDRLADEGLLDVVYERRSGRSGPGAGRPSKLYCRSGREVAVTLPGRRYDLAGELLAAALDEADRSGASPRAVLERRARETGRRIASDARSTRPRRGPRQAALDALEAYGYEPRAESDGVVLVNCPFHALAEQHTALVCGMNLHLLQGVVDELGDSRLLPRLDPEPGRCCVVLGAEPDGGTPS